MRCLGTKSASATSMRFVLGFGALGGITSTLQGGKFGHGFASAAVGFGVAKIPGMSNLTKTVGGRAIVSAVIGGTISDMTGGKFANGAKAAAFVFALRIHWRPHIKCAKFTYTRESLVNNKGK